MKLITATWCVLYKWKSGEMLPASCCVLFCDQARKGKQVVFTVRPSPETIAIPSHSPWSTCFHWSIFLSALTVSGTIFSFVYLLNDQVPFPKREKLPI
jgi:hypothetical protein